jgi:hypothetical protein
VAIFSLDHNEPLLHHAPCWSPNGYLIAAGWADSALHVFDLRNPKSCLKHMLGVGVHTGLFEFYCDPRGSSGENNTLVSLADDGTLALHYLTS